MKPLRPGETAWSVFRGEQVKGKKVGSRGGFVELSKTVAAAWRSLEPEQLEVRTLDKGPVIRKMQFPPRGGKLNC